jgi:N-acetylneuraminate synthase
MIPFSTPFDDSAVDFLESLDVCCYKIASFENTDLPLIRRVAATGKPLIISTGMATVAELDETVRAARESGCKDLILLKCTSTYPASPENTDILTIPHMRELFGCEVGLSDHTMGIGVSVASVALGATVIEKHFTLRRADGGVDSTFSMEPHEMKLLVDESLKAYQALGHVQTEIQAVEEKSLLFKRSIYAQRDLPAGHTIALGDVRVIRPALGLHPRHFQRCQGAVLLQPIKAGQPLLGSHLGWDDHT